MKNFLLLVCLVCCQIIASQCSLEQLAKETHIPLQLLTECRDRAEVLDSNLLQFLSTPPENLKPSLKEDLTPSVGCFLACVLEKIGLMDGAKMKKEVLTEVFKPMGDTNSDTFAHFLKHVLGCADSVEPLSDRCKVAMNFHLCIRTRPTHR